MTVRPATRYVRSGDLSIAYQVVGSGELDLVLAPGFVSNLDWSWQEPGLRRYLERLASFSRLILFDKRGTGLSDPVAGPATLEERVDDLRAVMDAAGSERAALLGVSEGGSMAMLFAAQHPERTRALVLYATTPRFTVAPDFPWGSDPAQMTTLLDALVERWGSGLGCRRGPRAARTTRRCGRTGPGTSGWAPAPAWPGSCSTCTPGSTCGTSSVPSTCRRWSCTAATTT